MDRSCSTNGFQAKRLRLSGSVRSPLVALILLPLLLVGLAACGRGNDRPAFKLGSDDVTLTGEATLLCNDQCRGSSQCGTTGSQWVVLANSGGPATESHDLTFPANAQVTIVANQAEVLQSVSDPSKTQRMMFYAVNVPDRGAGWVAGWCIGQLIVP